MQPIEDGANSFPPIALLVSSVLGFFPPTLACAQVPGDTVYRCPGPPVVYTDSISELEASQRGCKVLERRSQPPSSRVPVDAIPRAPRTPHRTPEPKNFSGSALLVSSQGLLLTNSHVVSSCINLTASRPGSEPVPAVVVSRDEVVDLALLQLSAHIEIQPLAPFRSTPLRPGEQIIVLGFPYRGLLSSEVNVSTGTVSALAGLRNDPTRLQIQAPVQPGNSGGPLLDSGGAVAGIVVAKLNALAVANVTGDIPQNINFAVKGDSVQIFLKSAGVTPTPSPSLPRQELADIVARTQPLVYAVDCQRR